MVVLTYPSHLRLVGVPAFQNITSQQSLFKGILEDRTERMSLFHLTAHFTPEILHQGFKSCLGLHGDGLKLALDLDRTIVLLLLLLLATLT